MAFRPGLYLDALRQARPGQLAARARRLVPPAALAIGLKPPAPRDWRPLAAGRFAPSAPQSGPAEEVGRTRALSFVGASRSIDDPGLWTDERDGLLFLFGVHGFDALRTEIARGTADADIWRELATSWLRSCGRPANPAWHPFPTSGRVLAWLSAVSAGVLPESVLPSVGLQARYLARVVEHDVGGNHVLVNAIAICAAGACLADDRLHRRGRRLLERELERQILSDGGHEERSTSYHRELLDLLEDLEAVLGEPLPRVADMRSWLSALAGPDGRLPLLNDAWEGPPLALPAQRPPIDELTGSGHVVLRSGSDQAVLDVGALCPSHLPPHAHADALSFCLWLDGEPVVADPGAGRYSGPLRDQLRGTRAHATVEVDGEDQCVFWGPFRASSLPRVERGAIERHGDAVVLHAWHNGYRRLSDPVVHHRLFCWVPGTGLAVVDTLVAAREHDVVSSLPLAAGGVPSGVSVVALGDGPEPAVVPRITGPYLGATRPGDAWEQSMRVAPGRPFGWAVVRAPASVRMDGTDLVVERAGVAPLRVGLPAAMLS